jgi:tetratricopeptide (TPR) repeat protein
MPMAHLQHLDEALKVSRAAVAVAERLAADHADLQSQNNLAISYFRLGDLLAAQDKLDGALKAYLDSLAVRQQLAAADPSNAQLQRGLQFTIGRIGGLAFKFILVRNFATALEAVDEAVSLGPKQIWLYTNRAHALMFLDRVDEARALYLKYRGQQRIHSGGDKDKSWEAAILEDFAEFKKAGLTHPLMQEIEKAFAGT